VLFVLYEQLKRRWWLWWSS